MKQVREGWGRCLLLFQIILHLFCSYSFAGSLELQERMQQELDLPGKGFDDKRLVELRRFHFVFVDGFVNELAGIFPAIFSLGNYFSDNIQELSDFGITSDHLGHSTWKPFLVNADELFIKLKNIYLLRQKRIILVGHSKGGNEVIAAILKHPGLLDSHIVEQVVAIQAPLQGSPLTENLADHSLARVVTYAMGNGLGSMRPSIAQELFHNLFEQFLEKLGYRQGEEADNLQWAEFKARYDEISDRVFFVTSSHPPTETLSWGIRSVLFFCKNGLEPTLPNDGLVSQQDQVLRTKIPFGHEFEMIADHIELVVSGTVSRAHPKKRRAFTRALTQLLYEYRNTNIRH